MMSGICAKLAPAFDYRLSRSRCSLECSGVVAELAARDLPCRQKAGHPAMAVAEIGLVLPAQRVPVTGAAIPVFRPSALKPAARYKIRPSSRYPV